MRIVVLSARYPSDDSLYENMFVHVRVARYLAAGHDVRVISFFRERERYSFEGVEVDSAGDVDSLNALIDDFEPDVLAIHFFQGWMLAKVLAKRATPVVVWVHAIDGMWWYRRLFNFEFSREFYHYVKYNIPQMLRLRRLFRRANECPQQIRLVFVSQWIRRVAEADTMTRLKKAWVIPNPIDTDRFPYREKDPALRTRVLLVRPFNSRKYANDIAVAAILELSKYPEFQEFHFSIVGSGRLFGTITAPLAGMQNVALHEGFLTHEEIRAMHDTHGVLLAPTRQDSHGVTTCEAMSSGLVPITSRSSAVPEFVRDNETGFLTGDKHGIVTAFRQLYREPELFRRLSHAAAVQVRIQCGTESVIPRELAVLAGSGGEL